MPQLNLSCSRRKYCAILRILAAISAGAAQDAASDGTARRTSAGQAAPPAPHSRHSGSMSAGTSRQQDADSAARRDSPPAAAWRRAEREAQLQHDAASHQPSADQRGAAASEWRLMDVSVHIAPKSSISLVLWDEDAGVDGRGGAPVPIAEMSIRNVTISYASFADESSTMEAGIGVIQGCSPPLLCPATGMRMQRELSAQVVNRECRVTSEMRAACDVRPSSANAFRKLISPQHAAISGMTAHSSRVLHLTVRSDREGSESVLWLGHLQVVIIRDALLSMLAVFQGPQEPAASQQPSAAQPSAARSHSASGAAVRSTQPHQEATQPVQDARVPTSAAAEPAKVAQLFAGNQQTLRGMRTRVSGHNVHQWATYAQCISRVRCCVSE